MLTGTPVWSTISATSGRSVRSRPSKVMRRNRPSPKLSLGGTWLDGTISCRAAMLLGRWKISSTVPSSSTLLSARIATRWQMASTTFISWVMMTTVTFSSRFSSLSRSRIDRVVVGSNAEVASSHSSTLGSVERARAMATRWHWPPESWAG